MNKYSVPVVIINFILSLRTSFPPSIAITATPKYPSTKIVGQKIEEKIAALIERFFILVIVFSNSSSFCLSKTKVLVVLEPIKLSLKEAVISEFIFLTLRYSFNIFFRKYIVNIRKTGTNTIKIKESRQLITMLTIKIPIININPHNKSTIPHEIIDASFLASDVIRAIIQPDEVIS